MARMRVCSCIGCPAHDGSCPQLTTARRCPPCSGQAEVRRGRRQARGYDAEYDAARRRWKPKVDAGTVHCHEPVCINPGGRWICPGTDWDLCHVGGKILGPGHSRCNRSAGGKAAHAH